MIRVSHLVITLVFALPYSLAHAETQKKAPQVKETYSPLESGVGNERTVVPPRKNIPTAPFEQVPATQVESISKRLVIVEQILRRHFRAYDYRSLTLQQLETILKDLDQRKAHESETPIHDEND